MNIDTLYSYFLRYPRIYTDSRKVQKNSIFFALKGKRYNGNLFAEEALEKGAKIVVVDQNLQTSDDRFFYVKDSLVCLQKLAKKHREKLKIPIIGITGTNGKTSTKEFIALLLSETFNVAYTKGNLNNHIGVPLTILSINANHTIAVLEFGANKKGDIKELCEIANPTHGLITNIGKAHLKDFINIKNITNTKTELWTHLIKNSGKIFLNYDDPNLMNKAREIFTQKSINECKMYGESLNDKNIISLIPGSHLLEIKYNGSIIKTKIIGKYNLINIICAITVASYFKIEPELIKNLLPKIGLKNRSELISSKKNEIILDAYNANPNSMYLAIKNFLEIENYLIEHKIIILGDMLELGKEEIMEHEKILKLLHQSKILKKNIFLIGNVFSKISSEFQTFYNTNEIIPIFKKNKLTGKIILIKGSRKLELEKLVEKL